MRLTVFFQMTRTRGMLDKYQRIDQSMPIVAETDQITNRRNSLLKSRVQISDGSVRRFFGACGKDLHKEFRWALSEEPGLWRQAALR
jgi:hypothetical protein